MTLLKNFEKIYIVFIVMAQVLAVHSSFDFYTAGVVEFRPNLYGMTSAEMLADHLRAYEDIIRSKEANLTDIIVFPEGTLNNINELTYVPAPSHNIVPCLQPVDPIDNSPYAEFLVKVSCIARDVRKYLVINLTEKQNCSTVLRDPRPCASTGLNIFNTNIVFDREGRLISRYRKVHVYVEPKNTTIEPEYAIFSTDFGVKFGHFICFDMLFYTPAQELITRHGIRDIIFPSFFYSELPFLTGTQLQQSWAWGNNVNLLAAGASYPEIGATGTGIYAGNVGHLTTTMIGGTGERKLYVARVPIFKSNHRPKIDISTTSNRSFKPLKGLKLMKDPLINVYSSELLDFDRMGPEISRTLCYERLCCHFHILTSSVHILPTSQYYKYRIGVFDGRRSYEKEEWSDIKVCALYTCTSDDVRSCGEAFDENTDSDFNLIFKTIEITGEFDNVEKMLLMPNTLNDQLNSLNSDLVVWNTTDQGSHFDVSLQLAAPYKDLRTFGIYAQYFERSQAKQLFRINFSALLVLVLVSLNIQIRKL